MTSHLDQTGTLVVPNSLYVGSSKDLSPTVKLVHLFGSQGPWEPGWYLLGQPCSAFNKPLAGPFNTEADALRAWEASESAFFAYQLRAYGKERANRHGKFGFMDGSALIHDPVVMLRTESLVMHERARVDAFVKLECGDLMFLGAHVHIASFCHLGIGGGVVIFEDGSSAGSGAKVLSGSASFDGPSWSATHPQVVNKKATTIIRKNATLLVNSVVLPGAEIGEGATIGAGAVVTAGTKVPAGEVWVGVPARKLR